MKSEAIDIDQYACGDAAEQFEFIYENFSVMQEILQDYKVDLITEVIEQKAYNRRAQSGELGVRIQVSMGNSNPTQRDAMNYVSIEKAIDEGLLDDDFFEGTDNQQELIRKATCYHSVRADYKTFSSKLKTIHPRDQKIIKPYLLGEKSIEDIANDLAIDYRSAVKHVYRIKKRLIDKVEPKMVKNRRGA